VKSQFVTELVVRSLDDSTWVLTEPLIYDSDIYNGRIVVPAGYRTDLASVPRVPIFYTAFGNRAHRESVVHDWLYGTHLVPRNAADRIFLEAMKVRGKALWIRQGMYWGVRIGGASSYESGPERYLKFNRPSV